MNFAADVLDRAQEYPKNKSNLMWCGFIFLFSLVITTMRDLDSARNMHNNHFYFYNASKRRLHQL